MAKRKITARELYFETSDGNIYELRPDGTYQQAGTAGAGHKYEASVGAGDANESSYFESYKRVKKPVIATTLASGTGAQNIGANGNTPVFLSGLLVQAALAGTLTVAGFTDPTGAAVSKIFPVGAVGQLIPLGCDLQLDAGCTMTLSVAADSNNGNVLVLWRNQ